MTEANIKKVTNNNWTSGLAESKSLIKIQGTLTSSLQLKGEGTEEPYYYSFIRLKGQRIDLPVIFKPTAKKSNLTELKLKKGDALELSGNFSISDKSVRKSFTATNYQLLNLDDYLSQKRIRKKCSGCQDAFICLQSEKYDYCQNCELNGSRYINKRSPCSECDGSGVIKFPQQLPRKCKLCYLTNQPKRVENILANHA